MKNNPKHESAPGLRQWMRQASLFGAALLASSTLMSCGQQAFDVQSSTAKQTAPGTFEIPAKVDILLVQDNSGSIIEINNQIQSQLSGFLTSLQSKGWDYHFAAVPLTSDSPVYQIVGSQYDPNWGSQWLAPYPGADRSTLPGTILASLFRKPENYTGYIAPGSSSNGVEQGFENITKALYNRLPGTNFMRDDALLVIMVVGNGDDTSKVNYCQRNGISYPCDSVVIGNSQCSDISQAYSGSTCGSSTISLDYYRNRFLALKPIAGQLQFHAAVASHTSCLGGSAYIGTRYQQMAGAIGGQVYDICNQSVSSILDQLSSSLQNQRISMRTRYLFMNNEPEISSIVVTRYSSGASETIPQDSTNGWTYAGQVSNVYAIDYPIPMNLSSGYAIELHGSAKLTGNQSADIQYRTKGLQNSH